MERPHTPESVGDPTPEQTSAVFAPQALLTSVVKGLAWLEDYRRNGTAASRAREESMHIRLEARQATVDLDMTEQARIRGLRIEAAVDPKREVELRRKELHYHRRKAREFGEHALAMAIDEPFLANARAWWAMKRKSSHERKASKKQDRLNELSPPAPRIDRITPMWRRRGDH